MIKKIVKVLYWFLYLFCTFCILWALAPKSQRPLCHQQDTDWGEVVKYALFGNMNGSDEMEVPISNEEQSVPEQSESFTYVNDFASILDTSKLEERLKAFHQSTSVQATVVTTTDLNGMSALEYATSIGQKWGIGNSESDNGIVIVIKPKQNVSDTGFAAIATGYGVEGILPDITCNKIVSYIMLPYFKKDQYDNGVKNALDMLSVILRKNTNASKDKIILPDTHVADFACLFKDESYLVHSEQVLDKIYSEKGLNIKVVTMDHINNFDPSTILFEESKLDKAADEFDLPHNECKAFPIWLYKKFTTKQQEELPIENDSLDMLILIEEKDSCLNVNITANKNCENLKEEITSCLNVQTSDYGIKIYNACLHLDVETDKKAEDFSSSNLINIVLAKEIVLFFIILMFVSGSIDLVRIYLRKMKSLQNSLIEEEQDKLREKGWSYKLKGAFYLILMLPAMLIGKIFGSTAKVNGGQFGGGGTTGSW